MAGTCTNCGTAILAVDCGATCPDCGYVVTWANTKTGEIMGMSSARQYRRNCEALQAMIDDGDDYYFRDTGW